MGDRKNKRGYRIAGHRQEFCHIYQGGRLRDGWACDCDDFARALDCEHAQQAATLYAIEGSAEESGGSSSRQ